METDIYIPAAANSSHFFPFFFLYHLNSFISSLLNLIYFNFNLLPFFSFVVVDGIVLVLSDEGSLSETVTFYCLLLIVSHLLFLIL